jgi:DNA-binding IclR family transcriptional regulator
MTSTMDRIEQKYEFDRADEVDSSRNESSVSKALCLLSVLAMNPQDTFGISELAVAAGFPKSTVHRLLHELQAHRLVAREGRRYRIGSGLLEIGSAAHRSVYSHIRDIAQPALERLFDRTRHPVQLGVLEWQGVLCLERITTREAMRLAPRVGDTIPVTCSSMGKALLAFSPAEVVATTLRNDLPRLTPYSIQNRQLLLSQLSHTRSNRLAFDREEWRLGVTQIACPIIVDDVAVAAVAVTGSAITFDPRRVGRDLIATAAQISADLADDLASRVRLSPAGGKEQ